MWKRLTSWMTAPTWCSFDGNELSGPAIITYASPVRPPPMSTSCFRLSSALPGMSCDSRTCSGWCAGSAESAGAPGAGRRACATTSAIRYSRRCSGACERGSRDGSFRSSTL